VYKRTPYNLTSGNHKNKIKSSQKRKRGSQNDFFKNEKRRRQKQKRHNKSFQGNLNNNLPTSKKIHMLNGEKE
jgi:hypothetical protein